MPNGTLPGKESKRRVIAAGKISGLSVAKIAVNAGCSARHVDRVAAEAETKDLVRSMLKPHEARLKRSLTKALNAIDRGLEAKLKTTHDYRAQLMAADKLREYIDLLRVDARDLAEPGERGSLTWEEFELMFRRRTVTEVAG